MQHICNNYRYSSLGVVRKYRFGNDTPVLFTIVR